MQTGTFSWLQNDRIGGPLFAETLAKNETFTAPNLAFWAFS